MISSPYVFLFFLLLLFFILCFLFVLVLYILAQVVCVCVRLCFDKYFQKLQNRHSYITLPHFAIAREKKKPQYYILYIYGRIIQSIPYISYYIMQYPFIQFASRTKSFVSLELFISVPQHQYQRSILLQPAKRAESFYIYTHKHYKL